MTLSATARLWMKAALAKASVATEIADAIDSGVVTSAEVTGALLTGYADAASPAADLVATDTVMTAFGKLQTQIDDSDVLVAAFAATHQLKLLTGWALGVDAADILATDTVLQAFAKIQVQLNAADILIAGKQATLTMTQATTGTVGTVGQVPVASLTALTGKIACTLAEAPGAGLAFSHVVVSNGYFTVFTINTGTDAVAELSGKKVNYIVIAL